MSRSKRSNGSGSVFIKHGSYYGRWVTPVGGRTNRNSGPSAGRRFAGRAASGPPTATTSRPAPSARPVTAASSTACCSRRGAASHFAWNFREQRIGGTDRTRWGNCRVVRAVLHGIAVYRRRNPDAPLVAVGDMGLRHGGRIAGHATHQNGRQIDLCYPRRDRRRREPPRAGLVDMRLARELVRAMLDAGAYRVLVGPHIRIRTSGRVMRWPNHDNHLHAMF
jgi:hypothetical protein